VGLLVGRKGREYDLLQRVVRPALRLGRSATVAKSAENGTATWDDVHDLELAIFELQPLEFAPAGVVLTEDYHAAIGEFL
jgi:hypothetical protein